MRFLVDGVPAATSTSGSNLGADSVAGVSASLGWIPFNLNQKLTLSPGAHTIAVQLSVDAGTLDLAQRYLQLTGFNSISGQSPVNVGAVARIEKELTVVGQSAPGGYTSVASQTVDVAEGESGEHLFQFSASVIGGSNPRFRYVVNGVPSETTTYGSLRGDAIIRTDDGWSSVTLPRSLNLSVGRHVVQVEVWNDSTTASLDVRTCFSSLLVRPQLMVSQRLQFNRSEQCIHSAERGCCQWLDNGLEPNNDSRCNEDWRIRTDIRHVRFRWIAYRSAVSDQRRSQRRRGTFLGSNTFTYTHPGWATLDLTRELNLSPGTHTIQVQVRTDLGLWA